MPIFIARVVRNVQVLVRNAIQKDKNVTLDTTLRYYGRHLYQND